MAGYRLKCPKLTNLWGQHEIGKGTEIGAYAEIGDDVVIGKDCSIQAYVFICPGTRIGDGVFIGPHVVFTNDKHPPSSKVSGVTVENMAIIGAGAVILPGVTIGMGAMIGAGAVVTKDVEAFRTVVGNPAEPINKGAL